MAWTKAKTAIVAGVGLLLATGTTSLAVKEFEDHRSYPWQINEGGISDEQWAMVAKQPPAVLVVPSKFHEPAIAEMNGFSLGTGLRAKDVVAKAYGFDTPARAVWPRLPANRYDFLACLPGGDQPNEKALQAVLRKKFGVTARAENRYTDVWLLRVKSPHAPGLKTNRSGNDGNSLMPSAHAIRGWNEPISNFAMNLEYIADFPVIDQTGLTKRYDFELNCGLQELARKDLDAANAALDALGLELVPTNLPIDMLVVERAR